MNCTWASSASVLQDFGRTDLDAGTKRELNRAWHRLPAWPDAVEGLARLKRKYTICTLSNGNIGLLTEMAKRAGLPWDCVLSAEVFKAYKPDPRTYLGVAAVFDVTPGQVMLAAAHHDDLAAARACGLRTGYIERPREFGPARPKDVSPQPDNTLHARDIGALADLLGALPPQRSPPPAAPSARWMSSILYPSGSVTKAMTVLPPFTGPASRVTLPPAALILSQAA